MQPVWLSLPLDAGEFRALLSYDGLIWISAEKTPLTKKHWLAGCFACFGLGSISASHLRTPDSETYAGIDLT